MLTPRHPNPEHPGWGGFRPGAGRPRKKDKDRTSVPHRARPEHAKRHPVHTTLLVTKDVHSLRTKLKLRALKQSLRGTHETRGDFRVVHFSLQGSHVHLIVEADNKRALWRGIRAVEVRIARRFNRVAGRKGRVFDERYHARALRTPRETKNAITYVLLNHRHHDSRPRHSAWLDPCSSAGVFDGWSRHCSFPPGYGDEDPASTARAETWLLREGWRRHGEISPDAVPGRR